MILRKEYKVYIEAFQIIFWMCVFLSNFFIFCIMYFSQQKTMFECIKYTAIMTYLTTWISYIPFYLEFRLNGGVDHKGLWEKQQLKKANELFLEGKNIVEISHEVRIPIDYLSDVLQIEITEIEKEQGYKYEKCDTKQWSSIFKALGTKKDVIESTGPTYGIFGIKNEMD